MASLTERWMSEEGSYDGVKVTDVARPTGKVTVAPVSKGSRVLGFVWTDGKQAGFDAKPVPSSDYALVVQYAGMVVNKVGKDAVTAKNRFDPAFTLGDAREYPNLKAAHQALLV